MNVNGHNALHIKRKIRPADYRRDPNCKIINPRTKVEVTLPVEVIEMIRNGEVKFT